MESKYRNMIVAASLGLVAFLSIYGVKKLFYGVLGLALGYLAAKYSIKKDFHVPNLFALAEQFFGIKIIKTEQKQSPLKATKSYSELRDRAASKSLKSTRKSTLWSSKSSKSSASFSSQNKKLAAPCVSFDAYFKNTYPWQSIFLDENLDKSMEEFLSLVIQNYVLNWYSQISTDDGFILEMKLMLRHVLAKLIVRLKEVDLNTVVTNRLNEVLFHFITEFYEFYSNNTDKYKDLTNMTQKDRVALQNELFKAMFVFKNEGEEFYNGHYALISRKHEMAYIRETCRQILPYLLPDSVANSKISLILLEEIFASNLMLNGLDMLAEPEVINNLIFTLVADTPLEQPSASTQNLANSSQNVQLLKHWSQMNGCIFKSIHAPSFKEVIEKNHNLHMFISYLNSVGCNSVGVLQVYLILQDLIKSYEESAATATSLSSSSSKLQQIQELKAWCELSSNKRLLETIQFDDSNSFYAIIKLAIEKQSVESQDDSEGKNLFIRIQSELQNLIKETYYSAFVKSKIMYQSMVGLKKNKKLMKNSMMKKAAKADTISLKSGTSNTQIKSKSEKDLNIFILNQEFNENDLDDDTDDVESPFGNKGSIDEAKMPLEEQIREATSNSDEVEGYAQCSEFVPYDDGSDIDNWPDEDDDNDDTDDNEDDYYYTEMKGDDAAKNSSLIRLDLINEIKNEMSDENLQQSAEGNKQTLAPNDRRSTKSRSSFKKNKDESGGGADGSEKSELADADYDYDDEDGDDDDDETNMDYYTYSDENAYGGADDQASEEVSNSRLDNVHLKHLRVCIDDIEELVDKSNKTCFVFVIQVWNIQPTSSGSKNSKEESAGSIDVVPSWCVKRKYDEFYVLDSRLKEFHGGLLGGTDQIQLPPKSRVLFFSNNSKNLEYLSSIKSDFTKYLQGLLTNPILSMSQLIRSFLDPKSIEFSSSIFNDITNLSKIVKGVPYKLRFERGQSLDPFLMYLLQKVRAPKAKPGPVTNVPDGLDMKLKNPNFHNVIKVNESSLKPMKPSSAETESAQKLKITPFDSFLCLITLIYKLPSWICLLVFSLRKFIKMTFNYVVFWWMSVKLKEVTKPHYLVDLVHICKDKLFGTPPANLPTSEETYQYTLASLNEFIYRDVLNVLLKYSIVKIENVQSSVELGNRLFLEAFQYPMINKQLTYVLLDIVIEELFPEVIKSKAS